MEKDKSEREREIGKRDKLERALGERRLIRERERENDRGKER